MHQPADMSRQSSTYSSSDFNLLQLLSRCPKYLSQFTDNLQFWNAKCSYVLQLYHGFILAWITVFRQILHVFATSPLVAMPQKSFWETLFGQGICKEYAEGGQVGAKSFTRHFHSLPYLVWKLRIVYFGAIGSFTGHVWVAQLVTWLHSLWTRGGKAFLKHLQDQNGGNTPTLWTKDWL